MTILLFVAILVILILVHEFGHFIAAKRAGVRVDEFGIGFPPRLFGWKRGETTYTLNLLPLGGFVKIFGEDMEEAARSGPEVSRSFATQKKTTQAIILSAGVLGNIILAWLLFSVGFMMGMPLGVNETTKGDITDRKVMVLETLPDSPAASAGFVPGDTITTVSAPGEVLEGGTTDEVTAFINSHGEQPLSFIYMRGDELRHATATPTLGLAGIESDKPVIGVALGETGIVTLPPVAAIGAGAVLTYEMSLLVIDGLWSLISGIFTGDANLEDISGPVGIAGLVGEASELGLTYLIAFTALISINLAIINLIPFPALDGGRLLFVAIEAIRGKPIRPGVAQAVNVIGFSLLILLMVMVTIQDVTKLL